MRIKTMYSIPMLYGLIALVLYNHPETLALASGIFLVLAGAFMLVQWKKPLLPGQITLSAFVASVIGIVLFPTVLDFCEYTSTMELTNIISAKLGFSIRRLWVFPAIGLYGISTAGLAAIVQLIMGVEGTVLDDLLSQKIRKNFFTKKFAIIFSATLCAAFLCHFQLLINGHGCPDWWNEGYYIYEREDWVLAIGRWAMRYINAVTLNIVAPPFAFFVHTVMMALTAYFIIKLWNIQSVLAMAAVSATLVSVSAVAMQYQFVYQLTTFGMAALCTTLSAYVSVSYYGKGTKFQVLAALLLALGMGAYQSYIGFAAGIILLTILLRLIQDQPADQLARQFVTSVVMGIAGCVIYYAVWVVLRTSHGITVSNYGGADQVNAANMLKNLPKAIVVAYRGFLDFYCTSMAGKNILMIPVLALFAVVPFFAQKWGRRFFALAMAAVTPLAVNIVCLTSPDRGVGHWMSHQMQLIIPFLLAVLESRKLQKDSFRFLRNCMAVLILYFCVNNALCAFATYESLEISHKRAETVASEVLDTLLEETNYAFGDKIVFVGIPEESDAHEENPFAPYNYSSGFDSAVFWNDLDCRTIWRGFMLSTFGVDTGEISGDVYNTITASEEFRNMGTFPEKDGIGMIDGYYVVKFGILPPWLQE